MFLTGEIERFGTGTLEMYNLVKERGLKPPLISLDEGFKLAIVFISLKFINHFPEQ